MEILQEGNILNLDENQCDELKRIRNDGTIEAGYCAYANCKSQSDMTD